MSRQYQLAVYFSLRYMYRTTKLTIDYFINSASKARISHFEVEKISKEHKRGTAFFLVHTPQKKQKIDASLILSELIVT